LNLIKNQLHNERGRSRTREKSKNQTITVEDQKPSRLETTYGSAQLKSRITSALDATAQRIIENDSFSGFGPMTGINTH
jgi:hypothetical protein